MSKIKIWKLPTCAYDADYAAFIGRSLLTVTIGSVPFKDFTAYRFVIQDAQTDELIDKYSIEIENDGPDGPFETSTSYRGELLYFDPATCEAFFPTDGTSALQGIQPLASG